ncbi:hypothetical protein RUM44_003052 [Polyplax serrata]|uniref:Uncharacterized protein n=1 Tax=Polyplax serrata TaxID=468196 RepID=A0ABR1AXJ2_POLSC
MNHNHNHNHGNGHEHSHGSHQHESKQAESDIIIIENREAEINSKLEKTLVANHVWETCKPSSQFTVKSPTVCARRIQLMRAQLLNPVEWASEPSSFEQDPPSDCKPKSAPKKGGCRCGNKQTESTKHYDTSSSVLDVIHACPDECQGDITDVEEEENEPCDYSFVL